MREGGERGSEKRKVGVEKVTGSDERSDKPNRRWLPSSGVRFEIR